MNFETSCCIGFTWQELTIYLFIETPTKSNPSSTTLSGSIESVSLGSASCDKQFVVVVSEKQARVSALPSHECVFKQQLADTDFVVKADVILLKGKVERCNGVQRSVTYY